MCPVAQRDLAAARITTAQAIAQSCALVESALSALLKMTHPDEAIAAWEGFYLKFKGVPGLLALLQSEHYNDLIAMCNCFIDARAGNGASENVRAAQ